MSKSSLKSKKLGRRKGRREKGYFFRTGRGGYVSLGHSMTKLCYAGTDQPIKDKGTDRAILEQAYEHWVAAHKEALKAAERDAAAAAERAGSATVWDIYFTYLTNMKVQGDSEATQRLRADYLWDFCTGYPARYRKQFAWDHQPTREELAALNANRIHDGYGDRAAESIIQADVHQWRVAQYPKRTRESRLPESRQGDS